MKKRLIFLTLALTMAIALSGCADSNTEPEATPTPEITDAPSPEATAPQESPEEDANQAPESSAPEFTFADVSNLEFYFSSGAGAWRTVLYINSDGSFSGIFSDSDMGDSGDDYPNGTVYYSQFSGTFTTPEKVDDTTYKFTIASLEYSNELGEEVKDGLRYIYSTAYGLHGAEELYIYLPGSALAELPQSYIDWVGYHNYDATQGTQLPFYGLYNATEECGFSSYKILTPAEIIDAEIASAEAADEEISQLLDDPYLTQADMNTYSYELYIIWDNALNAIWNVLKNNLDSDIMDALTAEEIAWIAEKEAAVEEAGKDVEGGSLYPTVVNSVAAEFTRIRVYELAEYISE